MFQWAFCPSFLSLKQSLAIFFSSDLNIFIYVLALLDVRLFKYLKNMRAINFLKHFELF